MRQEFEQIINRLGWIRSRLDEYIQEKGGVTDEAEAPKEVQPDYTSVQSQKRLAQELDDIRKHVPKLPS